MVINSPLVSIMVVTYNSQNYIKACLEKLFKTKYPKFEIIVVDNASSDKTIEIIKKKFVKVRIIQNKKNLGYAGGNNLGVKNAKGNLVAFINPDTQVLPEWLKPLVNTIQSPRTAACQPKIMLLQDKKLICATGKISNFLGFETLSNYKDKDFSMKIKEITSFSGSAVLIKKDIYKKLGGFDDQFFMYYEDGDLSWRIRLSGYNIKMVPESVVYHEYKFQPDEEYQKEKNKFYLLERNRMLMILKNYSTKTIFMILPVLILMEMGMCYYFLRKGWWREKGKEYLWLISNLSKILNKRKINQKNRKTKEREIVQNFTGRLEFKEINNSVLKYFANPFFAYYWEFAKKLI